MIIGFFLEGSNTCSVCAKLNFSLFYRMCVKPRKTQKACLTHAYMRWDFRFIQVVTVEHVMEAQCKHVCFEATKKVNKITYLFLFFGKIMSRQRHCDVWGCDFKKKKRFDFQEKKLNCCHRHFAGGGHQMQKFSVLT